MKSWTERCIKTRFTAIVAPASSPWSFGPALKSWPRKYVVLQLSLLYRSFAFQPTLPDHCQAIASAVERHAQSCMAGMSDVRIFSFGDEGALWASFGSNLLRDPVRVPANIAECGHHPAALSDRTASHLRRRQVYIPQLPSSVPAVVG